jgi:hypothetical protein
VNKPAISKPRYRPQGRDVRYRRSKAVAKRRLLSAIRDAQMCPDLNQGQRDEATPAPACDEAQTKEDHA